MDAAPILFNASTTFFIDLGGKGLCVQDGQASVGQAMLSDDSSCSVSKQFQIQSTPVISKSKGPADTVRDIRTSTYQMCRIEENTKRTTKFHK